MSEIPQDDHNQQFEAIIAGFNNETLSELDERLTTFELSTQRFITTFTSAMNGTAGQHFFDAIALSHSVRIEHVKELEEISEYLYDSMDSETAARTWGTIVRDSLIRINDAMGAFDPGARFAIPSLSELQQQGYIYVEGIDKSFEDGEDFYRVSEALDENEAEAVQSESIMVQDLPELLETEFDTEDAEDFEQMKDEYGQWVIAEYCNNIGEYLDILLEFCPRDAYPEIQ